jgi:hypothetical protein
MENNVFTLEDHRRFLEEIQELKVPVIKGFYVFGELKSFTPSDKFDFFRKG